MSACKLACMDKLSALSTKKKPLNLFKPLTRDFMNEMSENCQNYNYSFIMVIIVSTSTFNTPSLVVHLKDICKRGLQRATLH